MFDGLDEIFDPGKREDVITAIHRFTNEYPRVRVIVTSRIIGYKPQRLQDAGFHHFILQDLNAEQIQDFVRRWHELTFTDAGEKARISERMKRALAYSSTIRDLAGNPLLLTIMAILNRGQELPRDRAELYNQASRVLLYQWDVERSLVEDSRLDPKTIDAKDKQEMLRRVAYKMQAAPEGLAGNIISAEDLENTLTAYLKNKDFDRPKERAKLIINQLRTRNFILCYLGADTYGFVHRTFLEYFCASEVVERFEKTRELSLDELKTEVFGTHWDDESWQEVLCLIAGLIDGRFTGKLIEFLIEQSEEFENCQSLFLAAKCLNEVRDRKIIAGIDSELLERLKELTKCDLSEQSIGLHVNGKEIELIREIHTQAVSVIAFTWKDDPKTLLWLKQLPESDDDNWGVRYSAIQELAWGWKDDSETLPWLKQLAQSEDDNWAVRQAAVQELVRGWKNDPETLPILKQIAQSYDDSFVRRLAVQELAYGWKDDHEILPIVKQVAQSSGCSGVQSAAIKELVRWWKKDSETLPILKQLAQYDDSSYVREAALRELAREWPDDQEILDILKQRAQYDDDSDVREVAVQKLARGWKNDQEILPLIKQCAQYDENSDVRIAAFLELAGGWKDDPETLSIFKQCAQYDDDFRVRFLALTELAYGWKDEPEIFEWLCDLAITHPFERQYSFQNNPRQTALGIMVHQYPDRPKTLEILRDRFAKDPDKKVRNFAQQALAELEKL